MYKPDSTDDYPSYHLKHFKNPRIDPNAIASEYIEQHVCCLVEVDPKRCLWTLFMIASGSLCYFASDGEGNNSENRTDMKDNSHHTFRLYTCMGIRAPAPPHTQATLLQVRCSNLIRLYCEQI